MGHSVSVLPVGIIGQYRGRSRKRAWHAEKIILFTCGRLFLYFWQIIIIESNVLHYNAKTFADRMWGWIRAILGEALGTFLFLTIGTLSPSNPPLSWVRRSVVLVLVLVLVLCRCPCPCPIRCCCLFLVKFST